MTAHPAITRRIGIGLVAACAALLTASCAAGQVVQTTRQTPAVDGASGGVGDIQVHAAALKAPPVNCYIPGSDVALTFTVTNQGHDSVKLTAISSPRFSGSAIVANADDAAAYVKTAKTSGSCAPGASSAPAANAPTPAAGTPGLPAPVQPSIGGSAYLMVGVGGTSTDTEKMPAALLRGLTDGPLWPGESIPVTFTFGNAGSATLTVPVQLTVAPNNSTMPVPSGAASGG